MSDISGIILAGGYSSRMGKCKAELEINGISFIQNQVNKMKALGIDDIAVSGYSKAVEGTYYVADIYSHRGPLSGIHAGLSAIKNETAVIISVDTPLLPTELLELLISKHTKQITVTEHCGAIEPLIGIYEKSVVSICDEILQTDITSVHQLFYKVEVEKVIYSGDERLIFNCNTPDEYESIIKMI